MRDVCHQRRLLNAASILDATPASARSRPFEINHTRRPLKTRQQLVRCRIRQRRIVLMQALHRHSFRCCPRRTRQHFPPMHMIPRARISHQSTAHSTTGLSSLRITTPSASEGSLTPATGFTNPPHKGAPMGGVMSARNVASRSD